MSVTQTNMANACFRLLGQKRVDDVTTSTKPRAVAWRDLYSLKRQEMLHDHSWKFATKRVELETADVTAPLFEWTYRYELPADHLRVIDECSDYEFVKQENFLLTDELKLQIRYIFDETNVNNWSPAFVKAFYTEMARELAYDLTQDKGKQDRLEVKAESTLALARSFDSQEAPEEDLEPDTFLDVRSW